MAIVAVAAAMFVGAAGQTQQELSPAPTFVPDVTFTGSALEGWEPLRDVTWRAENREIVGTLTQPAGGWLVWNQSYQDVQFYARLKCDGPCNSRGGAAFVPELIHNRSGVGSQLVALDLNGDAAIDIVTATNRGAFVSWGTR